MLIILAYCAAGLVLTGVAAASTGAAIVGYLCAPEETDE